MEDESAEGIYEVEDNEGADAVDHGTNDETEEMQPLDYSLLMLRSSIKINDVVNQGVSPHIDESSSGTSEGQKNHRNDSAKSKEQKNINHLGTIDDIKNDCSHFQRHTNEVPHEIQQSNPSDGTNVISNNKSSLRNAGQLKAMATTARVG
ncbi:uncharacterized protein LOC122506778 [Leptopilina heterotoma]|uniref:uncharacterized protein LOC122506778 n=1 Tax=Leptopilina heterotoma TaxID=63436 RepID=UPI001CA7CE41|nr:uncharacterized protein LOC122506778 [Leptopilina heterotoma]